MPGWMKSEKTEESRRTGTWMDGEAVHQDAQEEAEQGREGSGADYRRRWKGWPGLTGPQAPCSASRLHSINTFISGDSSSVVLKSAVPHPPFQ